MASGADTHRLGDRADPSDGDVCQRVGVVVVSRDLGGECAICKIKVDVFVRLLHKADAIVEV